MQVFDNTLNWYKGNLHTHTTVSDGDRTPEEVRRLYRAAGYDFLALTDHDKLSDNEEKDGLLMLRGTELAINLMKPRRVAYHVVGIGGNDKLADFSYADCGRDPQKMIDHLKACGAFTILCHPAWSLMTTADIMALKNYDAVEVMNAVSDPYARGDASYLIDTVMAAGRLSRMVASDDAHFYTGEHCWAATMVNAKELTHESILEALYAGRYYATEGPRFKSIEVRDGTIRVRTSPVKLVRFMSDSFYAEGRRVIIDTCANAAVYEIKPGDNFVRVEAVDCDNRRAWSGYIDVRPFKK